MHKDKVEVQVFNNFHRKHFSPSPGNSRMLLLTSLNNSTEFFFWSNRINSITQFLNFFDCRSCDGIDRFSPQYTSGEHTPLLSNSLLLEFSALSENPVSLLDWSWDYSFCFAAFRTNKAGGITFLTDTEAQ